MPGFIRSHPLLTCMIVALVLRLFSVVHSKGFMANDDHFETVQIAYEGVRSGLLNDEGRIKWNAMKSIDIGRSPLYVLFNYSIMQFLKWTGIYDLDSMMYVIRLAHALLSLLLVWFGYKYVFLTTKNRNYAMLAGMILASHYLMPYLSVRNLVEMVSASLLVTCIYFAHRGNVEENSRFLLFAGIMGALSWMIRFNTGLAILPIPFVIWYLAKNFRPALYFCAGCIVIIVFSASLDLIYLGGFGRSTYNIFKSFIYVTNNPPLPHPFWTFVILILGIFIPPFSFYFIFSFLKKRLILNNLILFSSTATFFVIHSIIQHKEERFMIPIFPLLVILGTIGLHSWLSGRPRSSLNTKLFKYSAAFAIAVNFIVLPLFTFNYCHKGMVEPFVFLSKQDDIEVILIDRAERKRYPAISYAGYVKPECVEINNWGDFGRLSDMSPQFHSANYFLVYSENNLQQHLDSLSGYHGSLQEVFHSPPSLMDGILHFLNPRYNRANECWVYKRVEANSNVTEGG